MATVTELFDSGDGDMVSISNSAQVSRHFLVVVDTPSAGQLDDPPQYVITDGAKVSNPIEVGSAHPKIWDMYAADYTNEKRVKPQTYVVRVDYAPPASYNLDNTSPWAFSFSPGFGTKQATYITERKGKTSTDIVMGPRVFNKDTNGAYRAYLPGELGEPSVVYLSTNGVDRRVQPADVTYPIGTMTLSRQLRRYTQSIHTYLMSFRNYTNSDYFFTRPPGPLKFVGPNVVSTFGVPQGGTVAQVLWNVDLIFEDSDEGFKITYQEVWEEDGVEVPIVELLRDGRRDPQISQYTYYYSFWFSKILGMLDTYA